MLQLPLQLPQVRVSVSDNLPTVEDAEPSAPPTPYDLAMVQPHFAMPSFRGTIRLKLYIQNSGLTLIVKAQLCSFLDRRVLRGLSLGSAKAQFMVALVGN